ncbi:hypothetical protein AMEX_G18236 [Astyanax mexicanus]|uniref:Uncharacterized protein n=1 Tax=Astyanax mexicanus TaxID=7994 RepID=A0A8T2LET0_ASTMX|nr:hypothetical protein AMEX_G18236 [Astyanax mexicanus]
MEGSESSINRIGRTIWTVWGYLSGAVGRYLKPEVSNEEDKQNGEDTAADVTISKSYRELKEDEEETERSETNTWAQSESPQSGVRVRLAAVQWEKASIRKGGTKRKTGTGVAWNTGVQEGRKEGTERKVHEKRDGEASDNNNEAVRTKSNDFVEEAFVDAPSSINLGKGAQDFGDSGSVELGIDAVRSEHVISDNAEKAAMKIESAGQGAILEEPTNKCGFEDNKNVPEALDKKVIKHAKDKDENEVKEDEQETNQSITEDETEAYTSGMADDLLSHLTHSTKQMEDLFGSPSNEELKMDGEHSETTETTEIQSEREVIEASVEETKQRTEGFIKDEQEESKHDVVDYKSNLEEAKATAFELLEEPRTAQEEHREKEIIEHESEPVNMAVLTPGKEDSNHETMEEIVGTITDGNIQAAQQVISETLNICESKQDEAQFGFTEEIVKIRKEPVSESVCPVTEYEEILTPETELAEAIEESKLVTVGSVKEGQPEADLESSEFRSPEIVYKPNFHESELDESQTVFTEEMIKPECEALEESLTGQKENTEIHGNEPESFRKGTENDPASVTEESKQLTLATTEDEQQEAKQFSESEFAEAVELCESKLDESLIQLTEEREETECDILEEPVMGLIEVAERESNQVLDESEQHKAGFESSEFIVSEIAAKPDIHKSKLDENQIVFPVEMEETECEPLEESATGQMENAEIYGNKPESFSKGTENDPASVTEESKQLTLATTEDEQQEAKQFSESEFAEAVELCESKLDESPIQLTEEREETECDILEEPVMGHIEVAERESNQVLEESVQHKAGFESSEFIVSEIAAKQDIHKSKLDENQIVFPEEMEETESEPLEKPTTGQMENAEIYGKETEPISESTENETTPTTEIEPVNIIKQSSQMTLETAEDEHQEATQLGESKFPEAVDLCESKLDESPVQCTEERAKNEWDLVEEPVTGLMEVAETHGKDLEPFSIDTENEAAPTVLEESELAIVGTRKEGYHNAGFESSEFVGSEIADKSDIHKAKLDDNLTEFSEEIAETEERVMSEKCDLLVEHVTGHVEVAEVHGKDLEPSRKDTETVADLLPDSESITLFLLEPTQEIVVTGKSEQREADQQQLVSEVIGSEITENLAKLDETQSEFTAGIVETECEFSSKMTFNDESVDRETVEAIVEEADQLNQPDENSEAGTTLHVALRTEEETLGDTVYAIYGSQTPEMVIKQDSESVIVLVTEEPGNQSETTEFQQEVRAEVAADVMKKSAVMERVHEQPKCNEHLALQETMAYGLSVLGNESLQEFSDSKHIIELQLPEEQISIMQIKTKEMESGFAEQAEETAVESVDKMPSSSPQELDKCENVSVGIELLTGLTTETKDSFTAQKVEVLEVNTELTAVRDRVITEAKCEKAAFEMDASETESESTLAAVEAPETFGKSEASVSDETFGSQSLFKQDEWTVQDRSAVEPHGQQMEYSGELGLPESESALETSAEMQRDLEKGGGEDAKSPDETDGGFPYEKQVMMASLGVVNEVMRGLKQKCEESQSLSSREMDTHEKGVTETLKERVETSDPNLNLLHTVEIRQNLPVEAMDIGSERERKEEVSQHTTGDDVELLAEGKEDIGFKEEKADGEEKLLVDSNGNMQERSRPGLKRGFEKMARNEESKPTVPKDWAGTSLVLQQVSSLDCTVQKSKIAVKNPHVRPPKDPRTLINKASVEPLAPTRPLQPSPLRKVQGEGLIIPQKGVQGIGFKLPGLGAGFPALRKTDAGRKIRDEGETESSSTESLPLQKSDPPTETKEESVKPEQPANKPKWTPPRHPGMGNPMMMSELKSKLKKTGKE